MEGKKENFTLYSFVNLRALKISIQGHSNFKVTTFGISRKPTRNSVSLYNNVGPYIISKVSEDIASERLKIAVVENPTVV